MIQQSPFRLMLFITIVTMILTLATGCSLFDSENIPPIVETTLPTRADVSEASTPTAPKGTQIDFHLQGHLANADQKIVDNAMLTAQGPLPSPSASDSPGFTHMEVSGFPVVTEDASPEVRTIERKNGILELTIKMAGARRNPDTGKLEVFREVEYSIFIDQNTSEFLMCIIESDYGGTMHTYYFLTSMNTQIINDTLIKAYSD